MPSTERNPPTPQTRTLAERKVLEAVRTANRIRTIDLSAATGLPQSEVGPIAWKLHDSGQIQRDGDWLAPVAADEAPPMAPRRDPTHDDIRADEWQRIREIDPNAPKGGIDISSHVTRRALKNVAVCPPRAEITIAFDLDEDAEVLGRMLAGKVRELQDKNHISKRPNADAAKRQRLLRDFAAEHGTGVEAWERWKREHPDQLPYSDRRAYERAAKRALASRSNIGREMWEFAGRPEVERQETADGSSVFQFSF